MPREDGSLYVSMSEEHKYCNAEGDDRLEHNYVNDVTFYDGRLEESSQRQADGASPLTRSVSEPQYYNTTVTTEHGIEDSASFTSGSPTVE